MSTSSDYIVGADGFPYQLSIVDNGDGTFSPIFTRIDPSVPAPPRGVYPISQLLFDVLPRVGAKIPSGITIIGAANSITSLIFKRLLKKRSDLLATGRLSETINAGGYFLTLPDDFLSLVEKPHVMSASGSFGGMEPSYLNEDDHDELGWWDWYGLSGTTEAILPTSMKIINDTMYVRPKCAEQVTIRGRYYQSPAKITTLSDDVPFRSLFDEVYREGLVKVLLDGHAMVDADQAFMAFVQREVDTIVDSRVGLVRTEGRVARRNWI